jgi:hypothetical protein
LKPEFIYIFYEAIEITEVACPLAVKLFLQMPLREGCGTFFFNLQNLDSSRMCLTLNAAYN